METFGKKFTPEKLEAFKAELKKADEAGSDTFSFDEKVWLVSYGKYLARFLDGVFFAGRTEYQSRNGD